MTTQQVPLSRASTLPSRYYTDPGYLDAEKERVFGRTWQLVARAEELARVGDFVPVNVLDEPIVLSTHSATSAPIRFPARALSTWRGEATRRRQLSDSRTPFTRGCSTLRAKR